MVSVLVPKGSRAKDVLVDLSAFDTKAGTKCAKHLRIEHKPSNTAVQGDLSYFCRAEEDDLISHWEVIVISHVLLVVPCCCFSILIHRCCCSYFLLCACAGERSERGGASDSGPAHQVAGCR